MTQPALPIISAAQVHDCLSFKQLMPLLRQQLAEPFTMPQRQVLPLSADAHNHDAFALLPAWNDRVIGNKMFTYFPGNNGKRGLASLYSQIMLFERCTGRPLALVDGTSVTYWRTAAVSALASALLSQPDSEHLLLFGSGNLAPYLLHAHLSVRPINRVTIAARNSDKAKQLIDSFSTDYPGLRFDIGKDLQREVAEADVICCATGSATPLFSGQWLSPGCHVDCLGNHHPGQRECDSDTVASASVYVDSRQNTLNEAGELLLPIAEGRFHADEIKAELSDMCRAPAPLRHSAHEITLFKSVGTAISDLITADYVYRYYQHGNRPW